MLQVYFIRKYCWKKKKKLVGLIDTVLYCSECSLIKQSVVDKLGLSSASVRKHFIKTLSGQVIEINKSVIGTILLDELNSEEELLIVPNSCCPAEVLLSNTLIRRKYVGFTKIGYLTGFWKPSQII